MTAALRRPGFRLLFTGLVVSLVGDATMLLVPGILVHDLTGSAGAAGLTILFFILPVCAAPVFGWAIDRFRRKRLLVVACLLSAVALTPLLMVDDRTDRWIVYAVSAAMGASSACVSGTVTALLADLLPADLLPDANAAIHTVRQGLRLGGPLLGAVLYSAVGVGAVAVLDTVSFLVAAALFGAVRVTGPAPPRSPVTFVPGLTAGVRLVVADPALRRAMIATCALFFAGGVGESALYVLIDDGLDRPPAFLGVLATTTGVGTVLGGLLAARLIRRHGELAAVGAGVVAYGAATVGLSVPALPAVLGAAVVLGVGLTVPLVGRVTLLQRSAPSHLLGRATTACDAAGAVCQVVAIAAGAALVTVVSYRLLLTTLGALTLAAAAYTWLGAALTPPRNRRDRHTVPSPGFPGGPASIRSTV